MGSRNRCKALKKVTMTAVEAVRLVGRGCTLGTTGTTTIGYPRAFFRALSDRAREGELSDLTLWSMAPLGDEVDGALTRAGALARRFGMQSNRDLTQSINEGRVAFTDFGVNAFVRKAKLGVLGRLDIAVVEVAGIAEDGSIVPSLCMGNTPFLVAEARHLILEVNHWLPSEIEGLHEMIESNGSIPVLNERVGPSRIGLDLGKVIAVVESCEEPEIPSPPPIEAVHRVIAANLVRFLEEQWQRGLVPRNLLPVQVGLGGLGEAILEGLVQGPWGPIALHSPLVGDAAVRLLAEDQISVVSGSGLFLSTNGLKFLFENLELIRKNLILRPVDVVASPAVIVQHGCIALNMAVEVDLYGHVNSSHLPGGRLLSGVGGSVEFARNSALSIFLTPSSARGGKVSCIVPRVCHCDHTEHDVDIVVTEQGFKDLRGTDPRERATEMIKRCAHPDYREILTTWLCAAGKGHEPQLEEGDHSMHARYLKNGSMCGSVATG